MREGLDSFPKRGTPRLRRIDTWAFCFLLGPSIPNFETVMFGWGAASGVSGVSALNSGRGLPKGLIALSKNSCAQSRTARC